MITAREIGIKLRQSRRNAGYSQEQLGHYLGMEQASVSRIETGAQVPDVITYENWLEVCSKQPKRFIYLYNEGRGGKLAEC